MVGGFMHHVEEARKQQGSHQHQHKHKHSRDPAPADVPPVVWRLSLCHFLADPCMDMDLPRPRVPNR